MHYVIGSGPAGTACAKALLAQGRDVTMLDAGLELEPEKTRIIQQLGQKSFTAWTPQDRQAIRGTVEANAKGIPLKLLFGSDFPYRETGELIPWKASDTGFQPSLAFGGFSNVWGSAMLPNRDKDIQDWPIKNQDLAPHYQAVTDFTALAAGDDDLRDWFPVYCRQPQSLQLSRQAKNLLKNLESHRDRLKTRGIYNSADTVREMQKNPRFHYQRDVIVTRLAEEKNQLTISGFERPTRRPLTFTAQRAYLAAGVIPTAQILLRSQSAYDRTVLLRDSQYFLFPLLMAKGASEVAHEQLYTLSQLFIELDRPELSPYTVHLQVYTYSDIIGAAVRKTLGPLKFAAPLLEQRLLIVQGYVHSKESSAIAMTLRKKGAADVLQLEARHNQRTRQTVKQVMNEILKHARQLGGIAVPPMLQMAEPGRGFHTGGSFPMRSNPGELETDPLGRPHGWSRLHVVDASILPSIPATTITFTVMANAHRIGSQTANLEGL
jgi:choline dehydrogenase-like flavoprotein